MKALGIRNRLYLGFGLITVLLLIAMFFILISISKTENLTLRMVKTDLPTHDNAYDLGQQILNLQSTMHNLLLSQDEKSKTNLTEIGSNIDRIENAMNGYSKQWDHATLINQWQNIKLMLDQLKVVQEKFNNTSDIHLQTQLMTAEITPLINRIFDVLDGEKILNGERKGGMLDLQTLELNKNAQNIINSMDQIRFTEYLLIALCIVMSILITWFTAHQILKPLQNAINIAKKIASGERNIIIHTSSTDETGELLAALDTMQTAIRENEEKIRDSDVNARERFNKIVETANTYSAHSSKVSAGDLTQRLSIENQDEMAKLGKDLNTMTEGLASITKQIAEACHNMVSTLEQVKQSVDMQSSGASEQASSINQITASLGEIEKSSNQTIEKAKALGAVAKQTREKGELGLDAVMQSISGMKAVREKVQLIAQTILDLSNQTQQVGEITAVVNTLAQQSKMLALNASIEAAKAGEAGKGFAVVASEVKNLAEQSEQSTAQVQKILEDIRRATEKAVMATEEGTKGVDHGTQLVEQTGEIVRNLSQVIEETTTASQQIEAAIRQEGIGIEQIAAGMNEINQVTSSFVTSVQQTTAAMDSLALTTKNLKKYIDIYKT